MNAASCRVVRAGAPQAWGSVLRFGLCTVLLSLLLSLVITPLIHQPWLQVVRRCVCVAAVLSLWVCLSKFDRRSLASYGLVHVGKGRGHLAGGAVLGLIGLGIMLAVGLLSGACQVDVYPDAGKLWRTLIGFIPAALLVSVIEEMVFRGMILQNLLVVSKGFGVAASSALYALVHLKQTTFTTESWMELAGLFLFGGVLAVSYLMTGQLWLGIGLHASLAYGARVNKLVIAFSDGSMSWLVGTSRLVNGLSAWIALAVIGMVIWWWTAKSKRGEARHVEG
ncbi:MAG: CPBP family intramembrane metalloprotease [Candidatus Omnitrophica bacterium]|nr:CPBP family intramembrane metalloprotease [Candidatus Omnitrophota bacterium]